jgi:TolB-like protein/Flp pilus assembly protein TadD
MIRPDGVVKLLDFGIAKLSEKNREPIDEEAQTAISAGTSPGMIVGTAGYMSPEQARGKQVDARTDIFSFGVLLYEMLTTRHPFEGENAMDVIGSILHKEPAPIRQLLPGIPQDVERLINKTLRKNREERYQTAKDVLIDLKDARQELEVQSRLERTSPPNRDEPNTQIIPATTADVSHTTSSAEYLVSELTKRKRGIAIGLTVLFLAVIGLGYWLFGNRATPARQIESIAVMPFVNESGNADVEYLSDGMTEMLIKSLSNLPHMDVKPRAAVFRYKGNDIDLPSIGKELNVQAILIGRVVQRGELLTLSLELVDVEKNRVIWTEQYQRRQADIVLLQSEIAKDISAKLSPRLTGAEETRVSKQATADPAAYQAYLRGRYYWNKRTGEDIYKAIEQFQIAIDRDPNYALAFVGMADSYSLLPDYALSAPSDSLSRSEEFARRAIAIDGQLAEPHATLGNVYYNKWQWAESETEYKRAIELNPNYATAYHWYSVLLFAMGRNDEGAAMITRAYELDPMSSIINQNLAQMHQMKNDHKAAIEVCQKIIELDPNFPGGHFTIAWSYLKTGRNDEAIASFQKALELSGRTSNGLSELGAAFAASDRPKEAQELIRELEERYRKQQADGHDLATVYGARGDKDKAFEWLEKDLSARTGSLPEFRFARSSEPLRDDSRFKHLLKRMGLPE